MSPVPAGVLSRRAFDPASVSWSMWWKPDTGIWKDSARTTPASADGDPLGAVDDNSGNSRNGLQATSGSRPTLKTGANGLNGHNIIQADGTDDFLSATVAASTTRTLFVVMRKRSAVGVTGQAAFAWSNLAQFYAAVLVGSGYSWAQNQSNAGVAVGGDTSTWRIISLSLASASSLAFRAGGGSALATIDPRDAVTTLTTFFLGANSTAPGLPGDYSYAELLMADSVLSVATRDNVGNYLATKFGLDWTPIG